jgi:hypothetical protein
MDTLQKDSAARKVTVLLDEHLSRRLSEYCAAEGFKKSTLFVKLLRAHLDEARRQPRARRGRQLLNQRATAYKPHRAERCDLRTPNGSLPSLGHPI